MLGWKKNRVGKGFVLVDGSILNNIILLQFHSKDPVHIFLDKDFGVHGLQCDSYMR